jgi:uncharacterized cupin superfamily protein
VAVPEAERRETKYGTVYDGEGWFVVNARETRWRDTGRFGFFCNFEGKRRFPQLGINVNVLYPGQPMGLYHRERAQEAFLLVTGECVLVVEGEERQLRAWDFFHCPAGTAHIIVGAGDGPSLVLAFGARGGRKGLEYLVDEAALRHGAGVETPTTKPAEAYARFPHPRRVRCGEDWLPGS